MIRVILVSIGAILAICVAGFMAISLMVGDAKPLAQAQALPTTSGPYEIQLVYALPLDGADYGRLREDAILASVASAQRWFYDQTDGRTLGFAEANGRPTIKHIRFTRTESELAEYGDWIVAQFERELRAQGFAREGTLYAVYYEGAAGQCGISTTPPEAAGNTMALLLDSPMCNFVDLALPGEEAGYWELALVHEIFHLLGAVPDCAPHENNPERTYGEGHVYEPDDLMYHGPDVFTQETLDVGRDDYYGHGRTDCFDAARSPYLRPVSADVEPPQIGYSEVLTAGGCQVHDLTSAPADLKLSLSIVNATDHSVELRWVDSRDREEHYSWLLPWEAKTISGTADTVWKLFDSDGQCLTEFKTPHFPIRAWYLGTRGNEVEPSVSTETDSDRSWVRPEWLH